MPKQPEKPMKVDKAALARQMMEEREAREQQCLHAICEALNDHECTIVPTFKLYGIKGEAGWCVAAK